MEAMVMLQWINITGIRKMLNSLPSWDLMLIAFPYHGREYSLMVWEPKSMKKGFLTITMSMQKGIQPYVTLYHWDLPLYLHENMGGWLNKKIEDYFSVYADTCFASFGDRVKHWITINEPLQTAINGYGVGIFSPGRNECSSTEPYLVAHHQLLAHAAAVSIYPSKYKVYCSITFFCLFHLEIFIL